jgi:hypothetical protein
MIEIVMLISNYKSCSDGCYMGLLYYFGLKPLFPISLTGTGMSRIAYRLPCVAHLLARISGASRCFKLDLLDGYYQIRMRSEGIPRTAFTTPMGTYEFRVMPMGLCGAVSSFQYIMDEAFREPARFPDGKCVPFDRIIAVCLDDICISSSSKPEHLLHVCPTLARYEVIC